MAVWKYNLPEHIKTQHPDYSCDGVEAGLVVTDLIQTGLISMGEETQLGIPADSIPFKPDFGVNSTTTELQGQCCECGKCSDTSISTAASAPSKRLRVS
ncbi:hypothetical protein BC835DRAFT_216784 [Cytidiella melzeri]|nr:hypothetical protein BC835DRAFT_216784 [Cytidiella melzeri]